MNLKPVKAYGSLLDLLEGEAGHYRSLLSVLQREKKAIIETNLSELGKAGKRKEALLIKISLIEDQRQIMMEGLAESLGCSPHDLTITKLSELAKEPFSARFKSLSSDLLSLAETMHEVNGANKVLLKHSVGLIRSSFAFLNNLITADTVYYRSGRMQQNDQSGKVLCGNI